VIAAFPHARVSVVADGWEDNWRSFHRPVEIGPLWVGPPWLDPPPGAAAVVIDPGRAFGTGAHPTTRLCLEFLLRQRPGSLLDLGCGSGVIAIAAAALGYRPVLAVDLDPVAVEVASANARANGAAIEVREGDARGAGLPHAELAVANIALDAVCALGEHLRVARVVTSGYRTGDRPELAGFVSLERRELDGWAADLLVRR
jgi:ribosomal protein L11 methyltransferase